MREAAAEALGALLPHYEMAKAQRLPLQDPLCPPPPPRWKQVGREVLVNAGVGAIALFFLVLAGALLALLPAVQDLLLPLLKEAFLNLSPEWLFALAVALPLVASGLGWLARWVWSRARRDE